MNINENISIFKSATDPHPGCEVPLWWIFTSVQQCEFAPEVKAIRETTDLKTKAELKKMLPAVTISGTFSHRSETGLIKHSGFICLDIDGKDNPSVTDWVAKRDELGQIKEVVFSALSVSGNGCFIIIPLAFPDQHKSQFEALKRDFATLGITIDRQCGDIPRLRFLSSDPGAVINNDALEYRRLYVPQTTINKLPKYTTQYPINRDEKAYQDIMHWLEQRESFINGNRNHYITELAGCLHRFNVSFEFALSKCLQFAQADFTVKEIESSVRAIYKNQQWTGKAIRQLN